MKPIIQIIRLLRPYWRYIFQALFVSILFIFLSLPGPFITKLLLDKVYPNKDFILLYYILIIGAIMTIFGAFTGSLSSYFNQHISLHMSFDYQSRLYHHIQNLDFSFFDKRETGEIHSRFDDMQTPLSSTISLVNSLTMSCLQLIIFPFILFYIDWRLALLSIAVLPFDTLLAAIARKYYSVISRRIAEKSAELSAKTFESLSSIRTIQAMGIEVDFYKKLQTVFYGLAQLQIKSSILQNFFGFLNTLFKASGSLAYSWYGWSQVLEGNISVGTYMAFSGYVGYLYGPLENLIGLLPRIEVTLVHARRFFEIYELKPDIQDLPELPKLHNAQGDIKFHNVSFQYGDKDILHNIELTIPVRSTIALVGRSGAGKSTIAKLIPRFYDPTEGFISIDRKDIRQFRLQSLRQQIGFALQGSNLFQGSIRDNLTFGRDMLMQDVEDAARIAYIHDFITTLPEGYDTEIGEQGTMLSEGQKQRLALARVLVLDRPILILDEPMAALDTESEYLIQEALDTVQQGRTTIIIAHRLSTIKAADNILVVDKGKIIEQGSHETLTTYDGTYAGLYEKMTRK